ncbi:cholinesterase-like [Anopheles cruzii]|uniref:cholinesterase-like n=1 Tax=Anopheles cruzii TaxID=68878 RepID=UPI0022EC5FDE|nr:cholinesterase-like [Anopheles cruzii]
MVVSTTGAMAARMVLVLAMLLRGATARDPPTVTLPGQGTVMGMYMKMFRTQRVVAYLGLPYAQAPVSEKRFTPPVVDNLPSWEGVKNATSPAPLCWHMPRDTHRRHNQLFMELIQSSDDSGGGGEKQYDEDCLFLNIYIPDGISQGALSVPPVHLGILRTKLSRWNWVGVPHNFELIFLWGLPYWLALAEQMQWDSADKRVADIVMTLWANFAKFTNPTQVGVYIRWEKFTVTEPGVLIIDRSFNMSDHTTMSFGAVKFWNQYYPSVINFAAQCCNATYNGAAGGRFSGLLNSRLTASGYVGANFILLQSFVYVLTRYLVRPTT